ncbi:hypothetical protein SH2C18_51890 [Clostridium sediminicola]|uniref:N-acetylmuramoyl-L-alanine amidase family protein n=1 Tax=Clostridium sediminicola TaxID=3114879 RepID=UPI0031F1F7CA
MKIFKVIIISLCFIFVLASCGKGNLTNISTNINTSNNTIKNTDTKINNKSKNDLVDNIKKESKAEDGNKIIENNELNISKENDIKETEDEEETKEEKNKENVEVENKKNTEVVNKEVDTNVRANTETTIVKSEYKLKNNTIVIDPGHATKGDLSMEPIGPGDTKKKYKQTGGAFGYKTGIPEYEVNMQVAQKLRSYLTENGYNVVMTKTANEEIMANSERAKVGNESNAGLVIRIHADSSTNHKAKGASMLIPANNKYCENFYQESKAFGKTILDTVTNEVGIKNRGLIERSDISGFNWSTVPVILIEVGFLSNEEEELLLSSDSYQDKIAKAIVHGLDQLK